MDRFCGAVSPTLTFWRDGGYQQLVADFGIGNFGSVGVRHLFSLWGIPLPDEDFMVRAKGHVLRMGRVMADVYTVDGADFLRQCVLTYAEFEFAAPGAAPLRGAGCHTNGRADRSRWLSPTQPPFCPHADRRTCSEFRMLSSFCDMIARAEPRGTAHSEGRAQFTGSVRALVSGPCCVSCVGAFAQFRLLFPGIELQVAAGRCPGFTDDSALRTFRTLNGF